MVYIVYLHLLFPKFKTYVCILICWKSVIQTAAASLLRSCRFVYKHTVRRYSRKIAEVLDGYKSGTDKVTQLLSQRFQSQFSAARSTAG